MPKQIAIVIIAAMEREVRPLIRSWKAMTFEHDGRRYRLFENGDSALVCGGIGAAAARRATEAAIAELCPARIVSAGFAGALDQSLRVGDVLVPCMVINAADGVRTEVGAGEEILVTTGCVAGREQKISLRKAYGAIAVDMEAAAVAQGAEARAVEFGALKVISDASDFDLPALDRFVAADGRFRTANFALHVALRPWLWKTAVTLARNSSKASRSLSLALERYLAREISRRSSTNANQVASDVSQAVEAVYASAHTPCKSGFHTRTDKS